MVGRFGQWALKQTQITLLVYRVYAVTNKRQRSPCEDSHRSQCWTVIATDVGSVLNKSKP